MRHFQHVGGVQFVLFQHRRSTWLLHIAAQQEAVAAEAHAQHQRIVVLRCARREHSPVRAPARRFRRRRRRTAPGDRSGTMRATRALPAPRRRRATRTVRRGAGPQLARVEIARSAREVRRCGLRARGKARSRPRGGCRDPTGRAPRRLRRYPVCERVWRPNAGMPPPSTSMRWPSGKTTRRLSPCPTSMAVISNWPGMTVGRERVPQQQRQPGQHEQATRRSATSVPARRRPPRSAPPRSRPRATRAASECASPVRSLACQFTTCCESQSSPPASFATQAQPVKTATKPTGTTDSHERHHEGVGRESRRAHAVKIDHHGQRQPESARWPRWQRFRRRRRAARAVASRPAGEPHGAARSGVRSPPAGASRCGTAPRAAAR